MSNPNWIPLSVPVLDGREKAYVNECLESGWVSSSGPWVDRFEKEFAIRTGVKDAVSTSSGTAALHLALIVGGVKAGDLVLVPTLTFIAPINTVRYVGAEPVFFDCDSYLNFDLDGLAGFIESQCVRRETTLVHRATGKRIKAIIPVHIHGHLVDIGRLRGILEGLDVFIIEDATEALGSVPKNGIRGDVGCYSFNGNKIITTGGGGMLVSENPIWTKRARHLSTQAKSDLVFSFHDAVGYNYRLSSLQASLGIGQLEQLTSKFERKREIHGQYRSAIEEAGLGTTIQEPQNCTSNYWLTAVTLNVAVPMLKLVQGMKALGVEIRPLWELNHRQLPYKEFTSWNIRRAEELSERVIAVPSSPDLTLKEVQHVVKSLVAVCTALTA